MEEIIKENLRVLEAKENMKILYPIVANLGCP